MYRIVLLLLFFVSCKSDGGFRRAENALEAGREFIDNSLKGHFTTAKKYMLIDEENVYWLNKVATDYNKLSEQDKTGYSQASININEVADVTDSVTVINYTNSYKMRPQKIKVVHFKGQWVVDFKYTFSGNL